LASDNKRHQEALAVLTGRSPPILHRSLILIAFGFLLLLFNLLRSSWVFVYLGAMFLAIGLVYRFRKLQAPPDHSTLQLRISRAFMHAKIYGADGVIAATGSANLTFSGLNRNVEHVEVFQGPEASPVINSFYELWNRASSP
jgi:phosphatidylserine/phosphatidylglycerophosphate/cardiolipin synthase-like enzyme